MGARWAWVAVCSGPEHHIYSNFSGGADECYECGADCEVEFQDDIWSDETRHPTAGEQAKAYANERKTMTPQQIEMRNELHRLGLLADRYGYALVRKVD